MVHYLCFSCGKSVYLDDKPVAAVRCESCKSENSRQSKELRELESRLLANETHRTLGIR